MILTRRSLLSSAALFSFASTARAMGLGAGGQIFSDAIRQIGGVVDAPNHLIHAVEREFIQKFGEKSRHEFIADLGGRTVTAAIKKSQNTSLKDQIAFIANLLYTGEVVRDGKTVVLYYPWCLAWNSISFTKPPGLCGGPAFGHWEHKP